MRVIGAGLGRTGTTSLKLALERLLGGPCYHMVEVFAHPEHVPVWHAAARGEMPDWRAFLGGYAAAVDWPASAFWRELAAAFPEAPILLSTRDAPAWWRSASRTIFPASRTQTGPWREMVDELFARRFTSKLDDAEACISAYEGHNAAVRREAPPRRLVEWRPEDGWGPLCHALDLPVPAEPFPRVNTTEEFLSATAMPTV